MENMTNLHDWTSGYGVRSSTSKSEVKLGPNALFIIWMTAITIVALCVV
jgi:hypothetical protein